MTKNQKIILKMIGIAGTGACLILFILRPSFPTPDKLLVFLIFVFMAIGQLREMLERLLPFIAVILAYESFRSVADRLNTHVHYLLAPDMDKAIFGRLPTTILQDWWWRGRVSWYDYALYIPYLFHFILPIGLALLVWKTRVKYYWQVVGTYSLVAFMAFLTYFVFPAAPPWLASDKHYIPHITRISSDVWAGLGLQDFPSLYNQLAPNPVAAVPSLHAAWAVLLPLFLWKLYGRRWGLLATVYPLLIFIGTVYEGEHYVFDLLLGTAYALIGYKLTAYFVSILRRSNKTLMVK